MLEQWTDEREAELRQYWADGLTCSQIANRMGNTTRNAVIGKASRLKLPGRMTLERKAQCYRSGPISYEEKQRREAARYARRMASQAVRRIRNKDGTLPPAKLQEVPVQIEFLGLTLKQLERGHCRYPRGDGPFLFCGQPKMAGKSYCAHCYRICHPKPRPETPNNWVHWGIRRAA